METKELPENREVNDRTLPKEPPRVSDRQLIKMARDIGFAEKELADLRRIYFSKRVPTKLWRRSRMIIPDIGAHAQ